MMPKHTLTTVAFMILTLASQAQIRLSDYLDTSTDGVGRYRAMLAAHTYAVAQGTTVSYDGIDTLQIEIPADAKTIPLSDSNDFSGLVLYVLNNSKHMSLFAMKSPFAEIELSKEIVDGGDFRSIPELSEGIVLLRLNDKHPWTFRRGYGYECFRSDILYLHDGVAVNSPVAPYNTDSTQLQCSYLRTTDTPKTFANLTMHRVDGSQFKTYCVALNGQNNVTISNLTITTPKSKMISDAAISINNCTNITLEDVNVDGTYSGYGSTRNYGYAFSMGNVWNSRFVRVVADGNWGVFGSNNINLITLDSCDINRFDIHCYGRDARMVRCTLRNKQTQFSSMYGTVVYDSCRFIDCIPLRVRSSYNAYTPFDIVIRDCTFETTLRYHSIVNFMMLDTAVNPRPELAEKCWPNVDIENLTIVVPLTVGRVNVFDPTGTLSELVRPYGHIDHVRASGVRLVTPSGRPSRARLRFTSKPFVTRNYLDIKL